MRLAYAYIAPPEFPARADPCPFIRRVFRTLALDLPQTFEVFAHTGGHGDAAVRFRTPPDREAAMRRQPFELDGATLTLLRARNEIVPKASARDETAAATTAAAEEDGSAGEEAGTESKDLQQQRKALDKLSDHVEDRQHDSSRAQSIYVAVAEGASAGDARLDSKDLQQQNKALNKLTDHVEDRQLDSSRSRVQSIYEAAAEGASTGDARPDSKDLQQQSKSLDKLTDHVEDRQLDSSRVQSAMAVLASSKEANRNAMRPSRDKELDGVRINPNDVEIIANELELDKKMAERTLREHKGDAVAAVRFLLR